MLNASSGKERFGKGCHFCLLGSKFLLAALSVHDRLVDTFENFPPKAKAARNMFSWIKVRHLVPCSLRDDGPDAEAANGISVNRRMVQVLSH